MKVYNLTSPRTDREVPNQFVIVNGNIKEFQSYSSRIARYNTETKQLTIYPNWDYSNTTRKYFYQFLRNETCYYNICKKQDVLKAIRDKKIKYKTY